MSLSCAELESRRWPVRSLAVMEFSRLSCWSVVVSSLPPPPAPEHTEEELSTARPSASSTSLSIRSLDAQNQVTLWVSSQWHSVSELNAQSRMQKQIFFFCHLRDTRIAAVLFLPKSILLHKEVKALRLLPHVVKRHTFSYCSCWDLRRGGGASIHYLVHFHYV